jgi:hypothetical protein
MHINQISGAAHDFATNGHSSNTVQQGVDPPQRGSQRMPGVHLTVESDLFEYGKQFALASGVDREQDEDLRILRAHAEAVASDAARPAYDPNTLKQDEVIEELHQKDVTDLGEGELVLRRGQSTLAQRRDHAARSRAKVPALPREQSPFLVPAAVLSLLITIAPALHDYVWVLDDDLLSWVLSIVTGAVMGVLIQSLIISDNNHTGRRSITNWVGLVAGIGIGIGLFLLRVHGAEGRDQLMFGVALSVLEIAIVVFLEGTAMSRRSALRHREPFEREASEAEGLVASQEVEVARHERYVTDLKAKIDGHSRYVEERYVRANYLSQIRETAIKAVESGYFRGIAETRGTIRGVER